MSNSKRDVAIAIICFWKNLTQHTHNLHKQRGAIHQLPLLRYRENNDKY